MSLPSLPLFPDAYFGDTKHLSCEEHGAYLQLLMIAWKVGGSIPDDDHLIARMTSLTVKRWRAIKPTIMAFWDRQEDGSWTQKRLNKELSWVNSRIEKRRDAGRLGGRPKSLKTDGAGKAKGSSGGNQTESKTKAPTPTPIPIEEGAATAAPAGAGARPLPSKSRFDEVEATCRDAMGKLAPIDLVIGPVVQLADERGMKATLPAMIDAARSSRSPIRTWALLAVKARERLDAPPIQSIPQANGGSHATHRTPSYRDIAEADIERLERLERERAGPGPVLRIASG